MWYGEGAAMFARYVSPDLDKVVDAIATDDSRDALEEWAMNYPELWGNKWGAVMFGGTDAYGLPLRGSHDVEPVLEHWLAVADRIEALGLPE